MRDDVVMRLTFICWVLLWFDAEHVNLFTLTRLHPGGGAGACSPRGHFLVILREQSRATSFYPEDISLEYDERQIPCRNSCH